MNMSPPTPRIITAARIGNIEIVRECLNHGDTLLIVDSYKNTPLHIACKNGQTSMVDFLINIDTEDINKMNARDETPLHMALKCRNNSIIHTLVDANANPNMIERNGKTSLHLAATWGDLDIITLLLQKGALPNAQDHLKKTPLHNAVGNGHLNVAKVLVEYGAKATPDVNGHYPSYYAKVSGSEEMQTFISTLPTHSPIPTIAKTPIPTITKTTIPTVENNVKKKHKNECNIL